MLVNILQHLFTPSMVHSITALSDSALLPKNQICSAQYRHRSEKGFFVVPSYWHVSQITILVQPATFVPTRRHNNHFPTRSQLQEFTSHDPIADDVRFLFGMFLIPIRNVIALRPSGYRVLGNGAQAMCTHDTGHCKTT